MIYTMLMHNFEHWRVRYNIVDCIYLPGMLFFKNKLSAIDDIVVDIVDVESHFLYRAGKSNTKSPL